MSHQRNTSNNSSPYINFAKSRDTVSTTTSFTIVNSGDALGRISFVGADGTNFGHQAAKITGAADAAFGENDVPGRLEFYTTGDGGTTVTERMRIDSTGNVGIGTTTTIGARLELAANNASAPLNTLLFTDLDTATAANQQIGKIAFKSKDASGDGELVRAFINCFAEDTTPSAAISFAVNAGGAGTATEEAMRIDSNGNLGIGVTSIDAKLKVQAANGNTTFNCFNAGSGSQTYIAFNISGGGTATGSITTNGSTTAYNTSSDYRLKENISDLTGATARLKQLIPKRFNFLATPSKTVDGFLAHEVSDIVPEAVSGAKDAVDADGNPEYQGIDQSKLVPLLVATIQELEARIAKLEDN